MISKFAEVWVESEVACMLVDVHNHFTYYQEDLDSALVDIRENVLPTEKPLKCLNVQSSSFQLLEFIQ
ncbi:MAG: hypothetical protein ACW98U_16810 [Candidatus Thorarchaeota archaeon]|jgi:hypothetical protein